LPAVDKFNINHYIGLVGGGILITILGLLDDMYNLKALLKLVFQILAALIVVFSGVTINVVTWPWAGNGVLMLGAWSDIITVLWIIGITNAVNFIDGLDGLAAGISSIASLCLMIIAILGGGEPAIILLTAALAGSCMGFLPYNFNPASIFMGDTGSTFLGFSLAVISIQGLIKSYTAITIVVAVIILGLPIFDTAFAIIRRILNKKPIMQADRGHLHHKLVDRGYSQKSAVILLYIISGTFGIAGILVAMNNIVLAIGIVFVMFIVWLISNFINKNKKNIKNIKINK
jgi:UDP-GlcNAc:undecaprenyl-phosphate GlcNAc-1-phosphate transferase